ncbi:unnamed protein product, partial [Ectocarpus fasciculatus]
GRAARLTKEREAQSAAYEQVKNKIKEENASGVSKIDSKFNAASDTIEQEFRRRTVGLVTADDFRKAREFVDEAKEASDRLEVERQQAELEAAKQRRDNKRKVQQKALSFADDDEEEETVFVSRKKYTKNPTVDTSFLPDRERDSVLEQRRKELSEEWRIQQDNIKKEMMEVVYSYWDGSGHRKAMQVKKGATVGRFLELVKMQLSTEFPEVRGLGTDSLLYVKEDLIIPHHISFYDLIVTKARGKSGPLFHFDVHDDVRLVGDVRIEKDESHPGKVVERRWYERNKHIFPASRWELYDPAVARDATYTIHGGEVNGKN